MKFSGLLLALFALFLVSGCAAGQKHAYHEALPELAASGNWTVALATSDQRPYVLSGDKEPDVVGLARGRYGIPFNVTTKSEQPLADDITHAIAASLSKKGFHVVPVIVSHRENAASVLEKLRMAKGERLVLVTLHEWKSSTYWKVGLSYDVHAQIFDGKAAQMTEHVVTGTEDLGRHGLSQSGYSREALPIALKVILEQLFNDPKIVRALQR